MDGNHVCFFPPFRLAIEADVGARMTPIFGCLEGGTPRFSAPRDRSLHVCYPPDQHRRSQRVREPGRSHLLVLALPRRTPRTCVADRQSAEFADPALCVAGPSANYRADIWSYGLGGRGVLRGCTVVATAVDSCCSREGSSMPATKTPERVRASADATKERAEAALKRAGGSLDEVQKALADLQKDLGRGRRDMVRNVQQLVKNARRDMGKLNRALSADMRKLQKALTEEPTPAPAKGTTTRTRGGSTRAKSTSARAKGGSPRAKGATNRTKGSSSRAKAATARR